MTMQYPIPSVLYEIYCEFREATTGKFVAKIQAVLVRSNEDTNDDFSSSSTIVCPSAPWYVYLQSLISHSRRSRLSSCLISHLSSLVSPTLTHTHTSLISSLVSLIRVADYLFRFRPNDYDNTALITLVDFNGYPLSNSMEFSYYANCALDALPNVLCAIATVVVDIVGQGFQQSQRWVHSIRSDTLITSMLWIKGYPDFRPEGGEAYLWTYPALSGTPQLLNTHQQNETDWFVVIDSRFTMTLDSFYVQFASFDLPDGQNASTWPLIQVLSYVN